MEDGLRTTTVIVLMSLFFCQILAAQQREGSVCVAPNPLEAPKLASPGGLYNPATLLLKVDKRSAVPWPRKESVRIEGLDPEERHLVVLISDGRRIASFWFRFRDFKSGDLCISIDGYQGVQLHEARDSPWCKCK